MGFYNVWKKRKRGQRSPHDGDSFEYPRFDWDEKATHQIDFATELGTETISSVEMVDVNGVTVDSTTSSGSVVSFVVSQGGEGSAKLKITKSGGDITYVPLKWRSEWTLQKDAYRQ